MHTGLNLYEIEGFMNFILIIDKNLSNKSSEVNENAGERTNERSGACQRS